MGWERELIGWDMGRALQARDHRDKARVVGKTGSCRVLLSWNTVLGREITFGKCAWEQLRACHFRQQESPKIFE